MQEQTTAKRRLFMGYSVRLLFDPINPDLGICKYCVGTSLQDGPTKD